MVDDTRIPVAYNVTDATWGNTKFTLGDFGGVVTYSFAGAGAYVDNFYGTNSYTSNMSSIFGFDYQSQTRRAFDAWSKIANIEFIEVQDQGGDMFERTYPDIRIGAATIDGEAGSTVGFAYFPNGGGAYDGDIILDRDETGYWNSTTFHSVMLHEIGHAIGLDHSEINTAVMWPTEKSNSLSSDDIRGARALYGAQDNKASSYSMPSGQVSLTLIEGIDDLTIIGNSSGNTIVGSAEADSIIGSSGNDLLQGQGGNDRLIGSSDDDTIYGNDGADSLYGDSGNDVLKGGSGGDFLSGGSSQDRLEGGGGSDTLYGSSGDDTIDGGSGADTLSGGSGEDLLDGNTSSDRMSGGANNDTLFGGSSGDFLVGNRNDDKVYGESGNDSLYGGSGSDRIEGGDGRDSLYGDGSEDTLIGGAGDDLLLGNRGDDVLKGSSGVDTLNGGTGTDTAEFSGDSSDYTVVVGGSSTTVTQKSNGETDTLINIENIVYTGGPVAGSKAALGDVSGDASDDHLLIDLDGLFDAYGLGGSLDRAKSVELLTQETGTTLAVYDQSSEVYSITFADLDFGTHELGSLTVTQLQVLGVSVGDES